MTLTSQVGQKLLKQYMKKYLIFALWQQCIGIWSGTYNNMGLIIPMIKNYMIFCMLKMRERWENFEYEHDGNDLASRGLNLDIPGWRFHMFDIHHT